MSSMTLDLPNSYTGWMEIAGGTTMPCDAFVDGSQVPASSGATFEDRSARDGSVLANVAFCNEVDVNRAVAAARTAFEDGLGYRLSHVQSLEHGELGGVLTDEAGKGEQHLLAVPGMDP